MERTLLLENTGFPEKFERVEVLPPADFTKKAFLENQVLNAINNYNPKLNIRKIEYISLNDQFPRVEVSKSAGLIVEDIKIEQTDQARFSQLGYYIWEDRTQWFARKVIAYVFFTSPMEVSRNILVAQSIFPALIDYMDKFISSPSYTITNHPIYLINIINKVITAPSIIKPIAGLIAAGINYLEVFPTTLNPASVPKDLESFVRKYEPDCKDTSSTFVSNYYEVNFDLKKFKLKTTNLVVGDYLERTGRYMQFKGSSDKFYWMGILPITLIACNSNYEIDYSELEDFYNSNVRNFKANNEKFQRFSILLKYIKKITFS